MEFVAFSLAAIALLGSPGPGIAALVAVGRAHGIRRALPFLGGIQSGLLLAATLSALGLLSVLEAVPGLIPLMAVLATVYLLYLAWQIGVAPVGLAVEEEASRPSIRQGFMLGALNPKVYLALGLLMATHRLAPVAWVDGLWKVGLIFSLMYAVDFAWLAAGAALGVRRWSPRVERMLNLGMGATLGVIAVVTLAQTL